MFHHVFQLDNDFKDRIWPVQSPVVAVVQLHDLGIAQLKEKSSLTDLFVTPIFGHDDITAVALPNPCAFWKESPGAAVKSGIVCIPDVNVSFDAIHIFLFLESPEEEMPFSSQSSPDDDMRQDGEIARSGLQKDDWSCTYPAERADEARVKFLAVGFGKDTAAAISGSVVDQLVEGARPVTSPSEVCHWALYSPLEAVGLVLFEIERRTAELQLPTVPLAGARHVDAAGENDFQTQQNRSDGQG